ncbi:uncharacterized protein Pyn_25449 [Prunus yedoensis var. nudiflora]|uniref:Uncharacterized protein n=1 Tax=Prunus yedoensis var. nudiflora TaxID=2094558 RepID=A0A314UGM5_PRUYE|nr:uncharacterized protein Pyn_25449 [Prunus yedoensis var. nudiflora]
MSKAHENSYKSCNLFVGTSLVENIMPTVDPSLQPPVTESLEQELAVAQSPVEGISTKTNSESSELLADLSCSRKKKKKIRKERCKTQETNDESCGNYKICDLSVGTSLVENIMPVIDHSQQPPVSEFSEQKLELPPPLMEGISTKTNSESSGPLQIRVAQEKRRKA